MKKRVTAGGYDGPALDRTPHKRFVYELLTVDAHAHQARRVIAKSKTGGGYLHIVVQAVHTHACPFWRWGTKHGPCRCGAVALYNTWLRRKR